MVEILKNQKNVFWEALLITIVVFIFGLLIGVAYESSRLDTVNDYYAQSEISLMDIIIFQDIVKSNNTNCNTLINANMEFADKIFEEAKIIGEFKEIGKLTNNNCYQ